MTRAVPVKISRQFVCVGGPSQGRTVTPGHLLALAVPDPAQAPRAEWCDEDVPRKTEIASTVYTLRRVEGEGQVVEFFAPIDMSVADALRAALLAVITNKRRGDELVRLKAIEAAFMRFVVEKGIDDQLAAGKGGRA